jgi:hypothetical protein
LVEESVLVFRPLLIRLRQCPESPPESRQDLARVPRIEESDQAGVLSF